MMGSSKNRSSFRIADILHPQQQSERNAESSINSQNTHNISRKSPEENMRGSSSGHSSDLSIPHKPTAMYPSLMDLHKASAFPMPFTLGMHPFQPYLDYATAMHKGRNIYLF